MVRDKFSVLYEDQEPTDLELAMWDRASVGINYFGPLTQKDAEAVASYEAWCEESEREHELEMQHGGRTRCPNCDQFEVEHHDAYTVGYPGHPGAEISDYAVCRNCDYKDLAG